MIFSAIANAFRGSSEKGTVGQPGGGRRNPGPDAEYTGEKAITREEYSRRKAEADLAATSPPSTAETASANMAAARGAGERARKRAAAGGSLLTGAPGTGASGNASFAPKTLLGS